MIVLQILLIVLITSFFVYLLIEQLKIIHQRYLRSYKPEIEAYLKKRNLTLYSFGSPYKTDWEISPFKKTPTVRFSLVSIQLNGAFINWNDQNYEVIHTNEGLIFWLEVNTTYFKKPVLTFKPANTKKIKQQKKKLVGKKVKMVTDKCPACGFGLKKDDFECPDCGLNFR